MNVDYLLSPTAPSLNPGLLYVCSFRRASGIFAGVAVVACVVDTGVGVDAGVAEGVVAAGVGAGVAAGVVVGGIIFGCCCAGTLGTTTTGGGLLAVGSAPEGITEGFCFTVQGRKKRRFCSVILPVGFILTRYCLYGRTSTILPFLSHFLRPFLFWISTSVPSLRGGRLRACAL